MQPFLHKINTINAGFTSNHNGYEYLILLGKSQNQQAQRDHVYTLLTGCQAQVWMHLEIKEKTLFLDGYSDSLIVSGLIRIICQIYALESIATLQQLDPLWYQQLVIYQRLTFRRMLGFQSTLQFIHQQISAAKP